MLTTWQVHATIQQMHNQMIAYDSDIAVSAIAEKLAVPAAELATHISKLSDLYYISFTGQKKEKIRLTYAGRWTTIPKVNDEQMNSDQYPVTL